METILMNSESFKLIFSFMIYIIAVIIILISFIKNDTFKFFNIVSIFKKYFEFAKEQKIISLSFVVPVFIAIGTLIQNVVDDNFVDTIIVFLSILMAMFFGFITYFADYSIEKHLPIDADAQMQEAFEKTISETKMLSAYEIVITFIAIIICLIHLIFFTLDCQLVIIIGSAFIYFFVLHICLNLFVILKRFSIVFNI